MGAFSITLNVSDVSFTLEPSPSSSSSSSSSSSVVTIREEQKQDRDKPRLIGEEGSSDSTRCSVDGNGTTPDGDGGGDGGLRAQPVFVADLSNFCGELRITACRRPPAADSTPSAGTHTGGAVASGATDAGVVTAPKPRSGGAATAIACTDDAAAAGPVPQSSRWEMPKEQTEVVAGSTEPSSGHVPRAQSPSSSPVGGNDATSGAASRYGGGSVKPGASAGAGAGAGAGAPGGGQSSIAATVNDGVNSAPQAPSSSFAANKSSDGYGGAHTSTGAGTATGMDGVVVGDEESPEQHQQLRRLGSERRHTYTLAGEGRRPPEKHQSKQRIGSGIDRRPGLVATTDSQRVSTLRSNYHNHYHAERSDPVSAGALGSRGQSSARSWASSSGGAGGGGAPVGVSTRLHIVSGRPRATVDNLRDILRSFPAAASILDPFGRYPLHVLAENEAFAASVSPEEATSFLRELLELNPRAMLKHDIEGQLPFLANVGSWVENVHDPVRASSSAEHGTPPLTPVLTLSEEYDRRFDAVTASGQRFIYSSPRDVTVPPFVKWSLRMLSAAVDYLTPSPGTSLWRRRTVAGLRTALAKQAASVPFLFKTLLLVADEDEADLLFDSSILRPALLYPDVVGYWLVAMIRANNSRAVEFLERISTVTVADMIGGRKRHFSHEEVESFAERRKLVFDAVANLQGFVPSMLVMNSNTIEKAASTRVVTYVLDRAITDKGCVSFMLFDLVLEIIMVITYRIYVDGENAVAGVVRGCGALSIVISAYFLLREAFTAISMVASSNTMLRSFVNDFWTVNDVVSMALTFISCICKFSGISLPTLFAITIGFLWLKVLGTLKTLNMQLATFILALIEIVKDSRWFLLILFLSIIMFSDMIEIISKNSGLCDGTAEGGRRLDAQSDFCSPYILDSYVRIYAVLVGDVALDDFQQSPMITVLFVFFTFFGILILLSVLIAIVEDAYSRSKIRSFALFGRARVEFVARQQTRERFLRPVEDRTEGVCSRNHLVLCFRRILRWSVAFSVVAVAATVGTLLVMTIRAVFYEWRNYGSLRYLDLTLVVVAALFAGSLLPLLTLTLKANHVNQSVLVRTFSAVVMLPLSVFRRLLGIGREGQDTRDAFDDDSWVSKLHFMTETTKAIVCGSEHRVLAEVNKSITAAEERVISEERQNMVELEEEITKLRGDT